jgi:hypothetical protein
MIGSRAVACFVLLIAGGCTILNRPDRSRLDAGGDAGVDAFVFPEDANEAGIDAFLDGGVDANADAYVCHPAAEELCGNRTDDTCDGLVDCADPDCVRAMAPECCDSGRARTIRDDFNMLTSSTWQRVGTLPALGLSMSVEDFGTGGVVGMVRQDMGTAACLQAELGGSFSFTLQALDCSGPDCAGFAEVVVGPSSEFRAGSALDVDLGIRATSRDGALTVDVMRGTTVVAGGTRTFGLAAVTIVVQLALGVVDTPTGPRGALVARIQMDGEEVLDDVLVLFRDDVRTDLCPGVFFGIQGTGNDVVVDTLSITQLDCSNPSRVDPSDGIPVMTAATFSATDWASGGIGSPAILEREDLSDPSRRVMVLFDGSTTDRGSSALGRLPLSIGGGDLRTGTMMTANCNDWLARAGDSMPACEMAMPLVTLPPRAMRDPAMVVDGSNVRVLWAGERSDTDRHLALYAGLLDPGVARTSTLTVAEPLTIESEMCASIHSPQIVPLVGAPGEWLVFYVCADGVAEVHMARGALGSLVRVPGVDGVLGPAELGPVATSGVSDVAAVVFNYAGVPTYRLWLLTHGPDGALVSFAEGTAAPGEVPVFEPYAGNPIFGATDPDLGPCLGECELHGIAATRVPGAPTRVQLLVERWDTGNVGAPYALIPLRQSWPSD